MKSKNIFVHSSSFVDRGARIGYGAGLYDGLLPACGGAVRVGVAFELQRVIEVPEGEGDERVAWVVTEERTVRCG